MDTQPGLAHSRLSSPSEMGLEREMRRGGECFTGLCRGLCAINMDGEAGCVHPLMSGEIIQINLNWQNSLCASLNVMPIRPRF